MKKFIFVLAVTSLCGAMATMAQDKPSPEEARKVINYYFNGKGQGVIPMEYKLCKEISKTGDAKNKCIAELSGKTIAKGEEVYLWMNFLVPAGEESRILLQYSRKGKVRNTSNISLGGATRFRTWKKIPTITSGEWKVTMIQELENSDMDIGHLEFSVIDAAQ